MSLRECIRAYGGVWKGLKAWEGYRRRKINPKALPGPGDEIYTLYGWVADRIEDKIVCFRYPYKIDSNFQSMEAIEWCHKHLQNKWIYYSANFISFGRNEWRFKNKKAAAHFKMVWG